MGFLEEEEASGLGNVLLLSWLRGWGRGGVSASVVIPILVSDPSPVVLDFMAPMAFVSGAVCVQGGSPQRGSQWLTWHISSQTSRVLHQLSPVSAHFGK